jgi:hypothetical protein
MGVVLRGRSHSCEPRVMGGRGPELHSGDNAQTGEHQEEELDLLVISTGSDARNEREAIRDKVRWVNGSGICEAPCDRALHPQIQRHYFWPGIAPRIRSTT